MAAFRSTEPGSVVGSFTVPRGASQGPWTRLTFSSSQGCLTPRRNMPRLAVGVTSDQALRFYVDGHTGDPLIKVQEQHLRQQTQVLSASLQAMQAVLIARKGRVSASAFLRHVDPIKLQIERLNNAVSVFGHKTLTPAEVEPDLSTALTQLGAPAAPFLAGQTTAAAFQWTAVEESPDFIVDQHDSAFVINVLELICNDFMIVSEVYQYAKVAHLNQRSEVVTSFIHEANEWLLKTQCLVDHVLNFIVYYSTEAHAVLERSAAARQLKRVAMLRHRARDSPDPAAALMAAGRLSCFDSAFHEALTEHQVYHWWEEDSHGWRWEASQEQEAREARAWAMVNQLD